MMSLFLKWLPTGDGKPEAMHLIIISKDHYKFKNQSLDHYIYKVTYNLAEKYIIYLGILSKRRTYPSLVITWIASYGYLPEVEE